MDTVRTVTIQKGVDGNGYCRLEAVQESRYVRDAKGMRLVTDFLPVAEFLEKRAALAAALQEAVRAVHPDAEVRIVP